MNIKALLLSSLLCVGSLPATAQSDLSEASALSLLPVAISVAAPVLILSGGVALTVVAVEVSATGTVWIVERASDGVRASIRFTGQLAQSALLGVGAAITVTALSTGYVLSAAGQAIAFVPNAIGRALTHHEALTR